jgi:hypothetical protein
MKVSIQEKIAELESRIVGLESQCEIHFGVAFKRYSGAPTPNVFATDSHWRKMWQEFDLMMRELFGH